MVADSDSKVAWHRAQVRKNRATLKRIETAKFFVGEISDQKAIDQSAGLVADLRQKIWESEQVIALHDRRTKRPLATDIRSLSSVPWGNWTALGNGLR
jgi:hypothetical protein